jgi:hypothetical protein
MESFKSSSIIKQKILLFCFSNYINLHFYSFMRCRTIRNYWILLFFFSNYINLYLYSFMTCRTIKNRHKTNSSKQEIIVMKVIHKVKSKMRFLIQLHLLASMMHTVSHPW